MLRRGGGLSVQYLVLFGAGKRCRTLCQLLRKTGKQEIFIADNNSQKWGTHIENYEVKSPELLFTRNDIKVCITIADEKIAEAIRCDLHSLYGINSQDEIKYNFLVLELLTRDEQIQNRIQKERITINSESSVIFDCYMGLGLGGVEAWTMDLCSALISNDIQNVYIVSDNGHYDVNPVLINHILGVDIDHTIRYAEQTILHLVELFLSKLPCKVVTCTTDEVMIAAYLVKRAYPDLMEIISVVHNSNRKVYSDYMDFKECTDIYIGVSEDIKKVLIHLGIDKKRVYHMTCPFRCEKTLTRTYTTDMSKPIRIGYAGRMDGLENSQKRMDIMMKLIDELVQRKFNFKFDLAGDGPARKNLENFILERHLEEHVRLLGTIDRSMIPAFWKEQDIFVNVSDFEGRSISMLEAMANGAIPIVTETSGVQEEVINGENGYYVQLGDYRTIADRIDFLSKNRNRMPMMGQAAHDKVYPESMMENHIVFWKEILGEL